MQLTKENIAALRKRLEAVREQGKEYFRCGRPKKGRGQDHFSA